MFSRPTLKQLQLRVEADFSSRLLSGQNLYSRSVLKVITTVYAGACHLMYSFFEWGHRQVFPDTAEKVYLEKWARIWNIVRKDGAKASGFVKTSATAYTSVPAGVSIQSSKNVLYTTIKDATATFDNELVLEIEAIEIGEAGNQEAGMSLQFVSPIEGVENKLIVDEKGITAGSDVEDDNSLKYRLLLALREPPMGGNASDYVKWALEVDGVTRAWALPLYLGLGTVGLTFVNDDETDILPSDELIERVKEHIELVRPICAQVSVFKPSTKAIDIEIILAPYTDEIAELVKLELQDLFIREGSLGKIIPLSHINEAISITAGEYDHVVNKPTSNIIPQANEIPLIGNITITGAS